MPRKIYVIGADITESVPDLVGFGGGAYMSATFCKDHAPAGSRRKPNPRR